MGRSYRRAAGRDAACQGVGIPGAPASEHLAAVLPPSHPHRDEQGDVGSTRMNGEGNTETKPVSFKVRR